MVTVRSKPETPGGGVALRERILGAAFSSFMQHGYAGTSTLEIATRAKVSKRDLYALFGSKEAMLVAVIKGRAERMRMPLQVPAPDTVGALRATLIRFGTTLLVEMSQPEVLAIYRLAITESERSPDIANTLETFGRAETMTWLGALLQTAQDDGLIGSGDPTEMAQTFMALLWGGRHVRLLLRSIVTTTATQAERQARTATDGLMTLYRQGTGKMGEQASPAA